MAIFNTDSKWQWHQLRHMQICTLPQTDNHASVPPLSFYRPDALPSWLRPCQCQLQTKVPVRCAVMCYCAVDGSVGRSVELVYRS